MMHPFLNRVPRFLLSSVLRPRMSAPFHRGWRLANYIGRSTRETFGNSIAQHSLRLQRRLSIVSQLQRSLYRRQEMRPFVVSLDMFCDLQLLETGDWTFWNKTVDGVVGLNHGWSTQLGHLGLGADMTQMTDSRIYIPPFSITRRDF